MANISAIKLPDNVTYNIKDDVSGYITGMTILSYGSSTWQNFIDAYDANKVVYCRASSNSNPATGSQTRLAFLAYVNNATTPTEVEFQYYRSVSSHSDSQQGDQVYVYKLKNTGAWSVTTRESYTKIVAGGDLTSSYSNGALTISGTDANVTQTATSTDSDDYEVLFSGTADNTTRTEGARKSSTIKVNPSNGLLSVGGIDTLGCIIFNDGDTSHVGVLDWNGLTDNQEWLFPNASGTIALTSDIPTVPSATGSATTGISIAAHSTDSIYGVSSSTTSVYGVSTSTTTASKVTVGSHSTDYGVTAAGSGSASLTFTMDTTDTKKLKITFSHTHTAPTLGSKVPTVSASDVTVPIKNADATTVPIKNGTATTVVTSATHSVTDNGHTHTI